MALAGVDISPSEALMGTHTEARMGIRMEAEAVQAAVVDAQLAEAKEAPRA